MKTMDDVSPGDVVSIFNKYMRVKSIDHSGDGWYILHLHGYLIPVTGISNEERGGIEDEEY